MYSWRQETAIHEGDSFFHFNCHLHVSWQIDFLSSRNFILFTLIMQNLLPTYELLLQFWHFHVLISRFFHKLHHTSLDAFSLFPGFDKVFRLTYGHKSEQIGSHHFQLSIETLTRRIFNDASTNVGHLLMRYIFQPHLLFDLVNPLLIFWRSLSIFERVDFFQALVK